MFKSHKQNKNTREQWKVWFDQDNVVNVSANTDHEAAVIAVKQVMCKDGLCLSNTTVNVTIELLGGGSDSQNADFGELITVILELGKPPYWDQRRLPR